MNRGWYATGLLEPLWAKVGGRDELGRLAGVGGTTLSGYNGGTKRLGMKNAVKIARALGVTVADLGGPVDAADPENRVPIPDRLALVENENDALREIVRLGFEQLGLDVDRLAAQASAKAHRAQPQPGNDGP